MDDWGNIFNLIGCALVVIGAVNHSLWQLIPGGALVGLGSAMKFVTFRVYCSHAAMEDDGDAE